MFFVEDILPPELLSYYRNIRQICTTPQAVGELFTHPLEVVPLVQDRLIDFIRNRVAATGGLFLTICHAFITAIDDDEPVDLARVGPTYATPGAGRTRAGR